MSIIEKDTLLKKEMKIVKKLNTLRNMIDEDDMNMDQGIEAFFEVFKNKNQDIAYYTVKALLQLNSNNSEVEMVGTVEDVLEDMDLYIGDLK